ncbi:hypothetical protein RTBOTA2_000753 [Rhodotorula toruloides]|nr:hypothetical protein RTBOTA2_000753 [Rhodotorula toruloides]
MSLQCYTRLLQAKPATPSEAASPIALVLLLVASSARTCQPIRSSPIPRVQVTCALPRPGGQQIRSRLTRCQDNFVFESDVGRRIEKRSA